MDEIMDKTSKGPMPVEGTAGLAMADVEGAKKPEDAEIAGSVMIMLTASGEIKVMSTPNMTPLETVGLVARALAIVTSVKQPTKEQLITPVKGGVPFAAFRGGKHGKHG